VTPAVPPALPPSATLEWVPLGDATDDDMAARGLHRRRTLVELRRSLPLDPSEREGLRKLTVRPYVPGDDDALLEVNNTAFAWHPDQGGWDAARLASVLAEPWVDAGGILVHPGRADGGVAGAPALDGFCWTRVHPAGDMGPEPVGEIWVIAAHPWAHGAGLGAALVVAGLDHLAAAGLRTATLFTEEANQPARRMYDRLGFHLHERRGGYA